MPTLIIRHSNSQEEEHEFESELTIGRSEQNDLRLSGGASLDVTQEFLPVTAKSL